MRGKQSKLLTSQQLRTWTILTISENSKNSTKLHLYKESGNNVHCGFAPLIY